MNNPITQYSQNKVNLGWFCGQFGSVDMCGLRRLTSRWRYGFIKQITGVNYIVFLLNNLGARLKLHRELDKLASLKGWGFVAWTKSTNRLSNLVDSWFFFKENNFLWIFWLEIWWDGLGHPETPVLNVRDRLWVLNGNKVAWTLKNRNPWILSRLPPTKHFQLPLSSSPT